MSTTFLIPVCGVLLMALSILLGVQFVRGRTVPLKALWPYFVFFATLFAQGTLLLFQYLPPQWLSRLALLQMGTLVFAVLYTGSARSRLEPHA